MDTTPDNEGDKKLMQPQASSEESTAPQQQAVEPAQGTSSTAIPQPTACPTSLQNICSIASLTPGQKKWEIKACVTSKTPLSGWENANSTGTRFSMTLSDESGEIRATAFNNECTTFYDKIQKHEVYYISKCRVQEANQQFASGKNKYELIFNKLTRVVESKEDASSVPTVKKYEYDFVPICDIRNKDINSVFDVIGVCNNANDVEDRTSKKTGRGLRKRKVTLVDSSCAEIGLTLWGDDAETLNRSTHPVVSVKQARLDEFNGIKSLSYSKNTMSLDPDLPEAQKLRRWYDNGGADMEFGNISAKSGAFSDSSNEWITFSEANTRRLGSGDKIDYYTHLGVVTKTCAQYVIYKACPNERCKKKKMTELENKLFRCEKCCTDNSDFIYGMVLEATVSDPTGDQRIKAFNKTAETMLGARSTDMARLLEEDKNAYTQIFEDFLFKTFVFKFRIKIETYNDKPRWDIIAITATPVDYIDSNARLVKSIKSITGVQI